MSAIFLFLFHFFFKSDPPIVVARETTCITQPLRPDGLPDYEQYMLDANRKGATHDNNAAVLMWQALWHGNLDPPDYEPMRAELGFKELPKPASTLQPLSGEANRKRVEAWWKKLHPISDKFDLDDLIEPATTYAWTSREFPPMAEWVRANKKPLDLIVEASQRPRLYSPSPTMLNDRQDVLLAVLMPGTHNLLEAKYSLSVRAMHHIGENRLDEAWCDLLAIHRLARLAAQAPTLHEHAAAMSASYTACDGTLVLLSNEHLTPSWHVRSTRTSHPCRIFPRASIASTTRSGWRPWTLHSTSSVTGPTRLSSDLDLGRM